MILRQLDEGSDTRKVLIILTDDELRTHSLKNGLGLPIFSPAEIGKVSYYSQIDDSSLVSDWLTGRGSSLSLIFMFEAAHDSN